MKYYICSVSPRFPENYYLGIQAKRWGVEEKYANRIAPVKSGDFLIFVHAGQYSSIHAIESDPFYDATPLWPPKDDSVFPHRIQISKPIFKGNASVKDLSNQISFMKGKFWGGTIQGASGVFNDHLTREDFEVIKSRMRPAVKPVAIADTPASLGIQERQQALFRLYENEIDARLRELLPRMNLLPYSGVRPGVVPTLADKSDVLCRNIKTNNLVVLAFRKGEAAEQALVQILRSMSTVRQFPALANQIKEIEGIILTESSDETLKQIVNEVPNVSLQHYRLSIELV
jgi:hypothetical protein